MKTLSIVSAAGTIALASMFARADPNDPPISSVNLRVSTTIGGSGPTVVSSRTAISRYTRIIVEDYINNQDRTSQPQYAVLQRDKNSNTPPDNGPSVWTDYTDSGRSSVEPSIWIVPRQDGYDIEYEFSNTNLIHTPPAQKYYRNYGKISVYGFDFVNGQVEYTDVRTDATMTSTTLTGTSRVLLNSGVYPGQMFSPVFAMQGKMGQLAGESLSTVPKYAVGMNFINNVMDERHYTHLSLERPGISGGSLGVLIEPNSSITQPSYYIAGADMPSRTVGEDVITKKVVVAVRFMKTTATPTEAWHNHEWLRTLVPYRKWYMSQYDIRGPQARTQPTLRVQLAASNQYQSGSNPDGFVSEARIDQVGGWASLVAKIKRLRGENGPLVGQGWPNVMLWAPSGLIINPPSCTNCTPSLATGLNYPFMFASNWQNHPVIINEMSIFRDYVESTNGAVGLYWGLCYKTRSQWGSSNPANTIVYRPFANNSDSTEAWSRIQAEMNRATGTSNGQAGVTYIGMDEIVGLHPWEQRKYLQNLIAAYPGVDFIVEPRLSDLVQQLGAMYVPVCQSSSERAFRFDGPHVLAAFINPSSGVIAAIGQVGGCSYSSPIEAAQMAQARAYCQDGYSILMVSDLSVQASDTSLSKWALVDANGNPNPNLYVPVSAWGSFVPPDLRHMFTACNPADIANDQGEPLGSLLATGVNNGVNEGDYNCFYNYYFASQGMNWPCDIANDQGDLAPRFNGTLSGGPNGVVNEGDYNAFFAYYFSTCP